MREITSKTALFAVCGDPVSHSLSPVMHNGWIEDHGLDAVYFALRVRDGDAFKAMVKLSFSGLNVTVPHKEAAAAAADRSAARVANVLKWEADGSVSAFNTDGVGFLDALDEAAPDWRERVKRAALIGAGGAARGIAQALSETLDEIVVVNRTLSRAEALENDVRATRAARWETLEGVFAGADLIVNCSTLGMAGSESPTWPVHVCKPGTIVVDIVYRPLETPLLKAARARGLSCVDGLGMLIHQGVRSFEIWFGIKPDAAAARRRLTQALGET